MKLMILKQEIINKFQCGEKQYKDLYENEEINCYANYYTYIDNDENEIMMNEKVDLEAILYSKYYWYTKFMNSYLLHYGEDAGIQQGQFKILEEIDSRLEEGVRWEEIKEIEEEN